MSKHSSWRRPVRAALVAMVGTLALIAAGCGDSSSSDDTPSTATAGGSGGAKSAKAAALLPGAIRDSGTLRVGADMAYAPLEYLEADGKTPVGVDPDLAKAIAGKLGLKVAFTNATFGGLIPALGAGRFDAIFSFATDTPERQKKVDFVDAYKSGTAIMVRKGNPGAITKIEDLCGKSAGVQEGSVQVPIADAANTKCAAAGKQKIDVRQLPKDTDVQLLLKSGRITADLLDAPVAAYVAKTSGGGNDFEVVPKVEYGVRPHGIAVKKGDTQLTQAIRAALQEVIADGTYDDSLAKHDVPSIALKTATINGGTQD
jgi:polar amino acid transport system substrate-binding protein